MKQNGNHHASAILRAFTQGNLRQRTGNFNSFPAMYGTPRYDVTSRIMGLFPVTFYMEVSTTISHAYKIVTIVCTHAAFIEGAQGENRLNY